MSEELKEIFIIFSILCGIGGFFVSLICVAMVAGFTRSTHTVQYVPHDKDQKYTPEPEVLEENEKALFDKVGKKKKDIPTVVEELDAPIEAINQSDFNF